ncbi:MAG: PAS domain-containing protein, partial [Clostridia bacterium]
MRENNAETINDTTSILKYCGIQYWTYNPIDDSAISGLNAMSELGHSKSWTNFPQYLLERGLIDTESANDWLSMHEKVKSGERDIVSEIKVIEEGVPIWKKIQYHTTFDEEGKPFRAIGIAESITEYKSLYENFSRASKQCGVTLWMLDIPNRTIYDLCNATHIKMFDTLTVIPNVPEAFAENDSALYPDDVPALNEMFSKVYNGEKTASSVGRWWNDERTMWWWYEISYTTIFNSNGEPIKAIGTAIDITEQVRLEERYNEEIKWRKIHNKDVIGSYKMNLTQNTCDDGQSNNPAVLSLQSDGTVDGFFAREYATHMDTNELETYKKLFNRESLIISFRDGKTKLSEESYVNFGDGRVFWIRIEIDMFLNPKSGDIEAYIYGTDIDQKKLSRALVDSVVNMDYDYIALLDARTKDYSIFAKSDGTTPLPQFHTGDYDTEVSAYARSYLVDEDIENNIREMSCDNIFQQLKKNDIYTIYCRVKEDNGTISRKKLQFSYLDKLWKKIIITRT